jgi:hypothetical protein
MAELTLESLAQRIEALEKKLAEKETARKDWRSVVGIFDGDEGAKRMIEETLAIREAERQAAREGRIEE